MCGRSSCWTGRRTGCPHCDGSCWPDRWWQRLCLPSVRTGEAGSLAVLASGAILFAAGAPAAYTIETVATAHNGPMTTSGPAKDLGFGGVATGAGGPFGEQADNRRIGRARRGSAQPLGGSQRRLVHRQQPRTEDRRLAHGDRWLHRRRRLPDTRAVPGLRRQPRGAVLHRGRTLRPAGPSRRQRQRHHGVGEAELHPDRGRRHHRLRPHRAADPIAADSDAWRPRRRVDYRRPWFAIEQGGPECR